MAQSKRWLAAAATTATLLTLAWLTYQGPLWLTDDAKNAENFRGQLIQLIGIGVTAAVAIYGIKKHYLDKDKQYTDSFSAAIGHLGASDPIVRAGGIRELERIMHFTPIDRIRVLETCADFLRQHAGAVSQPNSEEPTAAADIAAVVAVIRRRKRSPNEPVLNLAKVRIPFADLRGADLTSVRLPHAELTDADLRGVILTSADLTKADLVRADLTGADLTGTRLTGARLVGALLTGATLTGADVTNAAFTEADLRGADLRGTIGLTTDQLEQAHTDADTRLP